MSNLAQIDDINLKVFDEICEEQLKKINLDTLIINDIDNLPISALPHLAEQYHTTGEEGWIFCQSEDEKRTLLKNAIKLHKYRGTKYGILKALEVLNLSCDIEEWFEYNGEPFFFKVFVDVKEVSYTSEIEERLINIINAHKNVRSWLECLAINLVESAPVKFASYLVVSEEITL